MRGAARYLIPLVACASIGISGAALAHSSDGKPCPVPEDIDIETDIEEAIGFPKLHDDIIDTDGVEMVCKDRFCLAHNAETKTPLWVTQKITRAIACGDNKRPHGGWDEAAVEGAKATNKDYTHSGYARGHNAASDDFKSSSDWMQQTFTFGNAVPQIQNGFNGSYWRYLEADVKHLALSGHDLYVITGPIPLQDDGKPLTIEPSGQSCKHPITIAGLRDLKQSSICGGSKEDGATTDCPAGVEVPAGMFKIVYLAKFGRVFAYAASNVDHRPSADEFPHHDDYIETWRVSVRTVEDLTNLEFFPNLDQRRNEMDKNGCIPTPTH